MKRQVLAVALALPVLAVLGLSACASDRDFGSSVRSMIAGQTANPGTPDPNVGAVDGVVAGRAVDAYRAGRKSEGSKAGPSSILITPQ